MQGYLFLFSYYFCTPLTIVTVIRLNDIKEMSINISYIISLKADVFQVYHLVLLFVKCLLCEVTMDFMTKGLLSTNPIDYLCFHKIIYEQGDMFN